MAFDVSTPDIPNYIKRIRQIQQVIIPESATLWTPSTGAGNYPYWLTLANNITQASVNESTNIITLSVDMLLIRGGVLAGYDGQVEMLVMQDMANVMSYFKRHKDLCTAEFPDVQSYYIPLNANLSQITRFEGSVQGGVVVIGSLYTLQFRHQLRKTNDSTATP